MPKFLNLRSRKYQNQVEKYLNYLIANQDLFQQTTSTIRGMVAIEQVELNREHEERECQGDREQLELYKQKEQEQNDRAQKQMEIGRKNEETQKNRSHQLENIIFFVGTAIGGGQIFWASYPLIKDTPIK
ncbi:MULTISPECIES: hypothetical protein [unclassified Microcoleus]|uniref:hypothetical protein n=1 Tax=unclassified Microcoleus TaxID=2642155 RepID=UPI002FD50E64